MAKQQSAREKGEGEVHSKGVEIVSGSEYSFC